MPIDKKSLELLRALAKQGEMHRDQLNAILGEGNLSDHTTLLMKRGLIEPRGSQLAITLEGVAFLENRRRQFWNFVVPYTLTTLIALGALLTQILSSLGPK